MYEMDEKRAAGDTAAAHVEAFLAALDRFTTSARAQGARNLFGNIASQADTAVVLPPFRDAYDSPGSARYPLNTEPLRALLIDRNRLARVLDSAADCCTCASVFAAYSVVRNEDEAAERG